MLPSHSFTLNASLLENDGLHPIAHACGNLGNLNDTITNLNIPLIDFTQLESSHSILGVGGNGVVWKGKYKDRIVAVKQTKEIISVNMVQEFLREALLSNKFEHPNILNFYGVCICPPEFLMVFEWCNQNELGQYLNKNRSLSPMSRLDIALQTVIGLEFFHDKGLVHRDIKPHNYLVHKDEDGKIIVKLADFGSSRSQYDLMPVLRGISPIFAPPELVKYLPDVTSSQSGMKEMSELVDQHVRYGPEVDIFSLGWVLWAILYRGNWQKKLKSHHLEMITGWKPCLENHDPQIQAILHTCWSEDPQGRPAIWMVKECMQALTPAHTKGGEASFSSRSMSSAFEISSNFGETLC